MTYGRSLYKAMEKFNLDPERWHELAVRRGAWREMLKSGIAPPDFFLAATSLTIPTIARANCAHQVRARLHTCHHRGYRRVAAQGAAPDDRHGLRRMIDATITNF